MKEEVLPQQLALRWEPAFAHSVRSRLSGCPERLCALSQVLFSSPPTLHPFVTQYNTNTSAGMSLVKAGGGWKPFLTFPQLATLSDSRTCRRSCLTTPGLRLLGLWPYLTIWVPQQVTPSPGELSKWALHVAVRSGGWREEGHAHPSTENPEGMEGTLTSYCACG